MRTTTRPTIPALESITFELLTSVSGGCHPKQPPPAPPIAAAASMNTYNIFQIGGMAAPAQSAPSEPEVETTVQYAANGASLRA